MTILTRTDTRSPAFTRAPGFGLGRLLRLLHVRRAVRVQRSHLARLDDAALRDIGLTRDEALAEAARPVWDVPGHWLR